MFYVYDGSFEGFLSAVTELFRHESELHGRFNVSAGICRESMVRPLLPHVSIVRAEGILDRFGSYLAKHFGVAMLDTIYRAFLSELPGTEDAIVDYIRLARRIHKDPIDMRNIDCVYAVAEAVRRTSRESHRFMGLLRFRRLRVPDSPSISIDHHKGLHDSPGGTDDNLQGFSPVDEYHHPCDDEHGGSPADAPTDAQPYNLHRKEDVYYAEFEPVTNCLPLVADHFVERFSGRPFLIADRGRNRCLIHRSADRWTILDVDPAFFRSMTTDTIYEELWQHYFKCLAIPERNNPALQAANMPKKYWKDLVEKPGRTTVIRQ
jgi:hypothetical protein